MDDVITGQIVIALEGVEDVAGGPRKEREETAISDTGVLEIALKRAQQSD